jgi:hypothetical protein
LADSPLPNDPPISVEAGADREQWMLEYLQIRDDEIERAQLICKIMRRIKDGKAAKAA